MAMKLFETAQGLVWIKSLKASNDDDHSDRINHRYTVCFLLICAFLGTGAAFACDRITCWVPAQFHGSYTKYTNNYCWISNTYYIANNDTIPPNKLSREKAEINYYQWVPFIFLLAAFFFYLPRMLWRSMNTRSGIDLQYLVTKSDVDITVGAIQHYCGSKEEKNFRGNRFLRSLFCTGGKRLGNYLVIIYVMMKFLYLINSIVQLIVVQIILGHPGHFYGFDVWYSVFVRNSVLTDSPFFPRVTLCDLHVREVGNLHRYTVQCVLPINMFNEKTFALTWFWLLHAVIVNIYSFMMTLIQTISPGIRKGFIRKLYNISPSRKDSTLIDQFVDEYLGLDGVLILRILEINGSAFLTTEVIQRLYRQYQEEQRMRQRQASIPTWQNSLV